MTEVRIGCSGWNYRDWRERFYRRARRWLAHHATVFDTVEVNATFYRLPKVETAHEWAEQAPHGSDAELDRWRRRIAAWRSRRPVFAHLNDDWRGFAPRNARKPRAGLS